jgi:hypothetical protein
VEPYHELATSKQIRLPLDHARLLTISIIGQWLFGWLAYVNEQHDHSAAVEVADFTYRMLRDTLENWQSEFLQLIWQSRGSPSFFTSVRRNRAKAMSARKRS